MLVASPLQRGEDRCRMRSENITARYFVQPRLKSRLNRTANPTIRQNNLMFIESYERPLYFYRKCISFFRFGRTRNLVSFYPCKLTAYVHRFSPSSFISQISSSNRIISINRYAPKNQE